MFITSNNLWTKNEQQHSILNISKSTVFDTVCIVVVIWLVHVDDGVERISSYERVPLNRLYISL